jgi:phosphoadenylyl-sulfate reductase (thioredoxin)
MVLIDMAARIDPKVRIFTMDTGRLPQETFDLIETVRLRYGVGVEIVFPDNAEVQSMTTRHGVNLFYGDVSLRKLCCHVRKVRPLERKLIEFDAYAVGLRASQSEERADVTQIAEVGGKLKLSPLANWTAEQVEAYIVKNDVPRHALYAQGYATISCAPCSRPIRSGESDRSGRWWWEEEGSKECGIHMTPTGALKRTLDVLLDEILVH